MVSAIKQYCIDSELVKLYQRCVKSVNIHKYNQEHGTNYPCPFSYNQALDILDTYFIDPEIRRNCDLLANAYYQRVKRVNQRIAIMLPFNCVWLTLTFTDECLASTTSKTRRKYVTRWLDKNSFLYVANIDYGSQNGREHYHALIIPKGFIDYTSFGHGAVNGERCYNDNDKAISKYIAKLTNHAIKVTTKNNKIIYSRKNDFIEYLLKKTS